MSGFRRRGEKLVAGSTLHLGGLRLWGVQVASAAVLAWAGVSALLGTPEAIDLFARMGFGPWLRYVAGFMELAGAGGLLVPSLAGLTSLVFSGMLLGAVGARLFVVGGSPVPAVLLLIAMAVVAWRRPVPSWKWRSANPGRTPISRRLDRPVLAGIAGASKDR